MLEAFVEQLSASTVRWNTDSRNVAAIVQVGSMIQELQDLALGIFQFSVSRQIHLDVVWIPRDQNSKDDMLSKLKDFDDFVVHDDVFFQLEGLWGPHTIDRIACYYNTKLPRFNSRFLQPRSEAVDAFSQDWSSENNWLVPPPTVIGKVLTHMRDCRAVGTLVVPMWKSAYYWTLLCNDGVHLNFFVKDWLLLPDRPDIFVMGRSKNRLFGTKAFKSRCLALRNDFAEITRNSHTGFCTAESGVCTECNSQRV